MNIEILQPRPFDMVGRTIMIAGNAAGFEGQLQIGITEGHVQIDALASAGSIAKQQFQAQVDIPGEVPFQLPRLFVTVKDEGGGEGVIPSVTVPVIFGPQFFETYIGYREYTVQSGDTLTSIAASELGNGSLFHVLQQANPHIITDPDVIVTGQVLRVPIQ